MSPAVVFIAMFAAIFGIVYLFFSTRNKERLALIEKGADASIFMKGKSRGGVPIWKFFILNAALLMLFIGIAFFIAHVLQISAGLEEDVAMPGTIFIMGGLGLGTGLLLSKKLEESERKNDD